MPRSPRTSMLARPLALLVLLTSLVGLTACDTITGNDEDITGTWVHEDSDFTEYLVISSSALTVYASENDGECFEFFQFEILTSEEDTYTVRQQNSNLTLDLVIRRMGDDLELFLAGEEGETAIYRPTDTNVSTLEICTGGGNSDPDIVCTELPRIDVGESVSGSLETGDEMSGEGAYYDLYSLQLTSAAEVRIDLTSGDIDAYLYAYESDGAYLAENDDGGEGLNAALTLNLDAGCYRIEATSYDSEETGSYTLSVN